MIIKTPSRLHMSLIDLNGSYKRIDGGIGLAIQEPQFVLESEEVSVDIPTYLIFPSPITLYIKMDVIIKVINAVSATSIIIL